jgi:hypothetical protein
MWDRSYRWQRRVRVSAGAIVLLALVGATVLLAGTSSAHRTRDGARDLLSELFSPAQQIFEVKCPADLRAQVGTLVFRDRDDGIAQVIGRVVAVHEKERGQTAVVIRLNMSDANALNRGGVLKGATAALSFRDAMRLLLGPEPPSEEAIMARDVIWPSIRTKVLPEIVEGLLREVSADLAHPGPVDSKLLKRIVEDLHRAIEPLEDNLVERMAKRAWDTVGVQGFAGGAWRAMADNAKTKGLSVAEWWSWLTGNQEKSDMVDRPFLSERTSQALKAALEEEVVSFWKDNRAQIVDALVKAVDARRQDFEAAFRERWAGALYDRVIMPAWQTGQAKVIESIQAYLSDFAGRRLLNKQGGPRLLFAFVLRSYLDISVAPLLILALGTGGDSDRIVYEPLLH